ncbi:MAG: hypothetical protein FWC26_09240 [Fibromonadales bacterium]|nr:hypothetical protein [Fibromonadales bacterium]
MDFFNKIVAKLVINRINKKCERFLEVKELNWDANLGEMNLTAKLKGEKKYIYLSASYIVQSDAIVFSEVKTEKEWLKGLIYVLEILNIPLKIPLNDDFKTKIFRNWVEK